LHWVAAGRLAAAVADRAGADTLLAVDSPCTARLHGIGAAAKRPLAVAVENIAVVMRIVPCALATIPIAMARNHIAKATSPIAMAEVLSATARSPSAAAFLPRTTAGVLIAKAIVCPRGSAVWLVASCGSAESVQRPIGP
jgi:hypothetical protein